MDGISAFKAAVYLILVIIGVVIIYSIYSHLATGSQGAITDLIWSNLK
jgi:hypothetical protein